MRYLRCLCPTKACKVLFEIHMKICDNHQEVITIAFKALQQGYYWPTMKLVAKELVTKCDACQLLGNLIHIPIE